MKKKLKLLILSISILLFSALPSYAASSYVLPYPSTMPGGIFYKIHLVEEKILEYWYFGSFGQFTYNLKQSDKYLVEAKTLFEYNQYLLGNNALKKSDVYFAKTLPFLLNAQKEGKDISLDRETLSQAALKHTEVLIQVVQEVPAVFNWTPEKTTATKLDLKKSIEKSIQIRDNYL